MDISSLHFLIVEDHQFQRAVALNTLRHLGGQHITVAADYEDALQLLHTSGKVDVVLCNIRTPGMDWMEFLRLAGQASLIQAIVIMQELSPELRRAAQYITHQHGVNLLGDVDPSLWITQLPALLISLIQPAEPVSPHLSVEPLSFDKQELSHALLMQQFRASYQPNFLLRSGTPISLEVQASWQHPELGELSATTFMPAMEQCGLLPQLFDNLLRQGLNLQQMLKHQKYSMPLIFSLHPTQLDDMDFVPRLKSLLRTYLLPSNGLTFALTENNQLTHSILRVENILRLHLLGCALSIDHFGTGFSSVISIANLPFSEIKLAASLVQHVVHNQHYATIIKHIMEFANASGITVVARGIQRDEQRQLLLKIGCTQGQGSYYASSMGLVALLEWLHKHSILNLPLTEFTVDSLQPDAM